MDLSSPSPTTNTGITPVFGDNAQDMLGQNALHVNPSAIITVNSIADGVDELNSGVTTLRDAINQANADDGFDMIVFDRSLFSTAQTITLNLGELDITHSLDIIAPRDTLTGEDLVTVSGNKASRVFEIETGVTVSIDGLIVANGGVGRGDNGAGILNSGNLTLDSSIVRNNSIFNLPFTVGLGGGIYNTGTLEVSNSTISGNSAASGGGIYNQGTLEVSNSTLSSNSANLRINANGGGINNTGTTSVFNSTFINNSAGANGGAGGGGISNAGILLLSNSTFNNNLARANISGEGGGIFNAGTGTLYVSNSTFNGNSVVDGGGGIYNGGTMTVSNSTLSNNSAADGGGIYNFGTMTVSNSTISGNSASGNSTLGGRSAVGGGIYNGGTLTLVFSTLTLNSAAEGSGVYNEPGLVVVGPFIPSPGSVSVRNTIIAANLLNKNGINPDVFGTFNSFGYNLIGDGTGSTGFSEGQADIVGTSDRPIDPRLAPLNFNGGPTQNFALLPDSPAIDAGDPTLLDTDPTTDQRGLPRVVNGRSDIGAYEVQV